MRFDPSTIPARMRHLERDRRGYPIPFIVFRDDTGKPHFTINDEPAVAAVITGGLCAICGKKLGDNIWCIGGPKAAFHERGCYLDPPVHKDCGTFALKTCPYIALPSYKGRIDDATLKFGDASDRVIVKDESVVPDRPALFVFSKTSAIRIREDDMNLYVHPKRPWRAVEYWKDGVQLTPEAAVATMSETEHMPDMKYSPDVAAARIG